MAEGQGAAGAAGEKAKEQPPAAGEKEPTPEATAAANPLDVLRSRQYLMAVVAGAFVGLPVSAISWGFLELIKLTQQAVFTDLPQALGFAGEPSWWPIPVVAVAGVPVALAIRLLPGNGGHSPADGFQPGMTQPLDLPGVTIAAFASLALGVVLGPEAPLIAIGGGLGLLFIRTVRPGAPPTGQAVVAFSGSFAAIATLLGSPLLAALFMMEGIGIGGPTLALVMVPGLAAVGIGSLVFIGLGQWSGLGTFSLAIPGLPPFARPTLAEIGWAVVAGLVAAFGAVLVRRGAVFVRGIVGRHVLLLTPVVGFFIGLLAFVFVEATGKPSSAVLFSGQNFIGPLIAQSASWSVGALMALLVCKAAAYALSLSSFRGGPIFPALLLGAALGIAGSHLPGLGLVAGVAMGMGAMGAAMLRLPVASVALPTVLLAHDGVATAPLVIVAVVVAYLVVNVIDPRPPPEPALAT